MEEDGLPGHYILKNTSKFRKGLSDKFMEKQTVPDIMGDKGLELVKKFLGKELGEKMLNKI